MLITRAAGEFRGTLGDFPHHRILHILILKIIFKGSHMLYILALNIGGEAVLKHENLLVFSHLLSHGVPSVCDELI